MSSNIRRQSTAGYGGATVSTIEYFVNVTMPDDQVLCSSVIDLAAAAATTFTLPSTSPPVLITSIVTQNQTATSAGATMTVRVNAGNTPVAVVTPAATAIGTVTNALAAATSNVALQPGQSITIVGTGTTPTGTVRVFVKGLPLPNL